MTDITAAPAKREQVAEHKLLNANGELVDDITVATGIRYIDKASGDSFDWQIPDNKSRLMLALFGAKTKATNVTSRVRQKNGKVGDSEKELEALDEVFGQLDKEIWREEAEGGGGSRTNKELLGTVLLEMLGTTAKGDLAFYVGRLVDDAKYLKAVLASDAGEEYRKRKGGARPAVNTLA